MSWRALLGVCAALLLPVPLVLLMGSVLHPRLPSSTPEGLRVSPVLEFEERMRRVTYRRHCQHASECEAPLGCLLDVRIGTHYCTDSQCRTDADCPVEQVCRGIATVGGGLLVRFCTPVGERLEGERCVDLPRDKEAACGPGLLCGGHQGWCARPCRRTEATSCPAGFFCAEVTPQPVCLPTCEPRRCPEDQRCVRFEEGASVCASVYGPDCQQSPCPEGRECRVMAAARQPGKVWTSCVERCGENLPACPTGLVCDGWECLPSCDPDQPNPCAEGYRCQQRRPDRPWMCLPDR
jgi:hypothetical protein